jgi:hypothetical protein
MMIYCKACKFWIEKDVMDRYVRVGQCISDKGSRFDDYKIYADGYAISGGTEEPVSLYTGQDFGCVNGEARDKESIEPRVVPMKDRNQ